MIKSIYEESNKMYERALKAAPGGVHSPVRSFKGMGRAPIFFKRAEGPYLFDVDGRRYTDFCQSFGPLMLGHRDPDVQEKVIEMINTAWTFGACEPYSLELAEWLKTHIPWLEKVRFVSSGTEAVMSALRVARGVTGKDKILKFEGCYHGHVDSLLVKSGSGLAGQADPSSAGISKASAEGTIVAPLDDEIAFEKIFDENCKDLAAVIIEPLPANYGLLPQRRTFLKLIEEKCKKNNVLLIFDEVISGFRVALGGMVELTGIRPDLVTYGKIIGGGFPVGCYGGKKEYMDQVAPLGPVYQAGTLSANPVGMVAGLATLQKMKIKNVWSVLRDRSEQLSNGISETLEAHGLEMTRCESLFWIHPRTAAVPRSLSMIPSDLSPRFNQLFLKLLDKGIYLAPNAYEVGFLSYAHTADVVFHACEEIKKVLNESR